MFYDELSLPLGDTMNQLIFPVTLTETQQDCVYKLKEALEQAERGTVNSMALVLCMKTGYAAVMGGTNAAELNLGLDSLKRKILEEVER